MNSEQIKELEKAFYTIDDLKKVRVEDSGERLLNMKEVDASIILEPQEDTVPHTGNTILMREAVALKLKAIQDQLRPEGFGLKITDGYRPVVVQEKYWSERLEMMGERHPELSGEELEKFCIRFTAKPEYAYHTTGGAVDLTIVSLETGKELDMGTGIDQFSDKAYTHYTDFSEEILDNRKLLYEKMVDQGFYNFPSEWWHFSYGTLDWALHYKKPHAIYGNV